MLRCKMFFPFSVVFFFRWSGPNCSPTQVVVVSFQKFYTKIVLICMSPMFFVFELFNLNTHASDMKFFAFFMEKTKQSWAELKRMCPFKNSTLFDFSLQYPKSFNWQLFLTQYTPNASEPKTQSDMSSLSLLQTVFWEVLLKTKFNVLNKRLLVRFKFLLLKFIVNFTTI